jgi:hypothetical protein
MGQRKIWDSFAAYLACAREAIVERVNSSCRLENAVWGQQSRRTSHQVKRTNGGTSTLAVISCIIFFPDFFFPGVAASEAEA